MLRSFSKDEEASSPLLKAASSFPVSRSSSGRPARIRPGKILLCLAVSGLVFLGILWAIEAGHSRLGPTGQQRLQDWSREINNLGGFHLSKPIHRLTDQALYDEMQKQAGIVLPADALDSDAKPVATPAILQDASIIRVTFHPNGYMLLPDHPANASRHPIFDLIDKGQRKWSALLEKQSKTLEEAVREYRRRYKRQPPKGFDKWWNFAQENNVVLKDEYDQIDNDLKIFRATDPADLRFKSDRMQERPETFTISVDSAAPHNSQITYSGQEAKLERATDLGDLIRMFAHDLPFNVHLTFTKHDNPAVALAWEQKNRMEELANENEGSVSVRVQSLLAQWATVFGVSDFLDANDPAFTNWANACPPSSDLRMAEKADPSGNLQLPMSRHRSFIYNHKAAMDVCQHPEAMQLHGYTSSLGTNLGELVPLFTFAKTVIHSDILATPLEQYSSSYIGDDPDWSEKSANKLLWRGSTTGAEFAEHVPWQLSQRARLHFLSHAQEGYLPISYADEEGLERAGNFSLKELNKAYMDTSFSGEPAQCDPVTCEEMARVIAFEPTMGLEESYQYKYLIDVDGNAWSGRFHRLMSTKSLVLKSTLFPEWYADRLVEWVHYVPVKVDYTDLYDILAFFIGTPDGQHDHDQLAQRIASAGKEWARDHWRKEDMASYMFRLLLEWGRILHRGEEESLDYVD